MIRLLENTPSLTQEDKDRIKEEVQQFIDKYGEDCYTMFEHPLVDDEFFLSKLNEIPSFKSNSVTLQKRHPGFKEPGIYGYMVLHWDEILEKGSGWHNGWTGMTDLNLVWKSSDPATQYIIDNSSFSNDEDTEYHVKRSDFASDGDEDRINIYFGNLIY